MLTCVDINVSLVEYLLSFAGHELAGVQGAILAAKLSAAQLCSGGADNRPARGRRQLHIHINGEHHMQRQGMSAASITAAVVDGSSSGYPSVTLFAAT
jgi:hypothetical protein